MERITKTAIRQRMNLYGFTKSTKTYKDHHTAIVLSGAEKLKGWFGEKRISYTEQVSFNRDGSAVSLFTVDFNQLQYLNQTNRTN